MMNKKTFYPDNVGYLYGCTATALSYPVCVWIIGNNNPIGHVIGFLLFNGFIFAIFFYSARLVIDNETIEGPVQYGYFGRAKIPRHEYQVFFNQKKSGCRCFVIRHTLSGKQFDMPYFIFKSSTIDTLRNLFKTN